MKLPLIKDITKIPMTFSAEIIKDFLNEKELKQFLYKYRQAQIARYMKRMGIQEEILKKEINKI